MRKSEILEGIDRYEAALNTAIFVSSEGNYELALKITQCALEKLNMERESAVHFTPEENISLESLEEALTQKYIAFRSKIDKGRQPYWKSFINTLIICAIISTSILITVSIVLLQLESVTKKPVEKFMNGIQETVNIEITKMTTQLSAQIPTISYKIQDEIPKISRSLTKIANEKIERAIDRKLEVLVDVRLPQIVESKLKGMSKVKN